MDRLELRLDKHSHYAQLTICCQAIKYLCVHENLSRKCQLNESSRFNEVHGNVGFYARRLEVCDAKSSLPKSLSQSQRKLECTWLYE